MIRLDKWLWAARFYKTRQLAVKAIKTGKIDLNGNTVSKPATTVKLGDTLSLKRGPYQVTMIVAGVSEQRGPAKTAQTLYQETNESVAERERLKEQLAAQPKIEIDRRKPDKHGVRNHRALKRGESSF